MKANENPKFVLIKMKTLFLKSFTILIVGYLLVCTADAQIFRDRNRAEPLPDNIKERLIKLKIDEEKKDHDKLLKQSEEVAVLSEEIQASYTKNKALTSKDQKKLDRVEKLLKKIRRELRAGKDDKEDEREKPSSLNDAISNLHQNTLKLYEEVKKTTRHSISVVAIQSSNAVLKLVKFIRFKK